MAVFADTSGLLASSDRNDGHHARARQFWEERIAGREVFIATNYVLTETFALIQSRLGIAAVREFQADMVPLLGVQWVDEPLHQAGIAAVLAAGRRQLSLVDCVSFEVMRRLRLAQAFAFDRHFEDQGFTCLP